MLRTSVPKSGTESNILITGISGFIGSTIARHLAARGHRVYGVSRNPKIVRSRFPGEIIVVDWSALTPDFFRIRRIESIINLAGAPMIQRWNDSSKAEILLSRKRALERIFELVRSLPPSNRPSSIISASSSAIYSNQQRIVDEYTEPQLDINFFQSIVWRFLEQRIDQLCVPKVRNVTVRIGIVIGPYAIVSNLLIISRCFGGSILGSGNQKISWISHHDLARAFDKFIFDSSMNGTYNLVSPQLITSKQLSIKTAGAVNRPVWFRIPNSVLRLALGELATNFLISAPVRPTRLIESDFHWNAPDFADAIGRAAWEIRLSANQSKLARDSDHYLDS